jgi:hypothetical protein
MDRVISGRSRRNPPDINPSVASTMVKFGDDLAACTP